jgi:hypothetical protein
MENALAAVIQSTASKTEVLKYVLKKNLIKHC